MGKRLLLLALLGLSFLSGQAQTSFTFTLGKSYRTSAGVFAPDGTLLRALWNDVEYPSGTFQGTWDGKDNEGVTEPAGTYTIKVLTHNVSYIWDGPIANSSRDNAGSHLFRGYLPISDMATLDTAVYYVYGYSEGSHNSNWFNVNTPTVSNQCGRTDIYNAEGLIATDGPRQYEADNGNGYGQGAAISFVTVDLASNHFQGTFTNGRKYFFPSQYQYNIIDFDSLSVPRTGMPTHNWIQNGASGLAVEVTSNILAVAHYAANQIRLFDKITGSLISNIAVSGPSHCRFSSENDLWVITGDGANVVRYTNMGTTPTVGTTITGFSHALSLDVDPTNPNIIIVADGGTSQQVKAYNKAGSQLWTLGVLGGNLDGDPGISNTKFFFQDNRVGPEAVVCIQKDHSFWIGDPSACRTLHFDANQNYLNQIYYTIASYSCSVDQTDPTRVFNSFQEYKIDYSLPIKQSWTYVKNWAAGTMASHIGGDNGIRQCTTLPNGRTYMLFAPAGNEEIWELPATGPMRETGNFPYYKNNHAPTLTKEGTLTICPYNFTGTGTWYTKRILGSDITGNLKYADSTILAQVTAQPKDPTPHPVFGDLRTEITAGGVLITNDASNGGNYHLGGIKLGTSKYLWRVEPVGTLNRKGNYDTGHGCQYEGDVAMVSGHNVVAGFHGEFWNQSQAGQYMHYWDDGLFVGQFGNPSLGAGGQVQPGFAGNAYQPAICTYKGETYIWTNDESNNGPQRWHLANLNTIHELVGSGLLNSALTLY